MDFEHCPECGNDLVLRIKQSGDIVWEVDEVERGRPRVSKAWPLIDDMISIGNPVILCRGEQCQWSQEVNEKDVKWI